MSTGLIPEMRAAVPPSTWILNAPQAPSVWERYASLGTARSYRKGVTIFAAGEPADQFFYLRSGRVQLHVDRPDGRRRIFVILEPGSTFGESSCFSGFARYVSATTLEDTETIAFAPGTVLAAMTGNADLIWEIVHTLALKQHGLGLQTEASSLMPTRARVALLLSHLGDAYGRRAGGEATNPLRIHVSIDQLAAMLGMARVTLSRALGELIDAGAIARDKRDLLLIDAARLTEFSLES